MSDLDLARLAVAKRAFQATQPSAAEVQTGVRRARLALRRPKTRKGWFGKGLVLVVLAIGSLAYAKPQALTELVNALPGTNTGAGKAGRGLLSVAPPATPVSASALRGQAAAERLVPAALPVSEPARPEATTEAPAAAAATAAPEPRLAQKRGAQGGASAAATPLTTRADAASSDGNDAELGSEGSKWGRVGQALANGDDSRALTVLDELARSDDTRTRDKADLGRAQLMLAHGNRDGGCSLARSLMNRRAGGRIERQAQTLLKNCSR